MKKSIQLVYSIFLFILFSLITISADLVGPIPDIPRDSFFSTGSFLRTFALPILVGLAIIVLALIAWLIIRDIKKKNANLLSN